jgi:hypothetical protein
MIEHHHQKGFALIYLIFIMVALGGMGAAIYSFTTSSAYTELTENSRNRAYQLARAGMNYAHEQYAADPNNLNSIASKTYSLANSRGQITYTITPVGGVYQVVSIGTVNNTNGLLLARAQVQSSNTPGSPDYFPIDPSLPGPPGNGEIMSTTFNDLKAFESNSLKDAGNHTMIRTGEYIATNGIHRYWASFTDLGTYARPDADNPGCNIGFHVGKLSENNVQKLKQLWHQYNYVDYDVQAKVGWYKETPAAVSGLNFRWHEVPKNSGKYEGYGLAYMRYTYDPTLGGCGGGYDYLPNSLKPPGQAGKLLLVLWEQRVEGGVERRRWLAYALLGNPATWNNPRAGADLKVVGAQDDVDGLLNDDALLVVRVREKFIKGRRVNDIHALYGDASPYYGRTPNSTCSDINRKRMPPEWIDSSLFPRWPSNKFNPSACGSETSLNFWFPDPSNNCSPPRTSDYYEYFTLMNRSSQIVLDNLCGANPVQWIVNPAYAYDLSNPDNDPNIDSSGNVGNPDRVSIISPYPRPSTGPGTLRTYKFILNDFDAQTPEIGLHGMGNLNNSDRVVAFDDWAIQSLGESECQ